MKSFNTYLSLLVVTLSVVVSSCSKDSSKEEPTVANFTVATIQSTAVTQTTATFNGNLSTTGSPVITARGFCYGTTANPTTSSSKTATTGIHAGSYSSSVTGLTANTTYHVRAYASTTATETKYGVDVEFKTLENVVVITAPTVTTTAASSITTTTAVSGGNITSNGGEAITASGVCYSTSPNPTTAGTKVTNSAATGSFTSYLTGLVQNTTYYVKAYATNSKGTSYGAEISFKTLQVLPIVTNTTVTGITSVSAYMGATFDLNGLNWGTDFKNGICYSTNPTPTIGDGNRLLNQSGVYTCDITGLTPNTKYYVRGYFTANGGTTYSNEISFNTLAVVLKIGDGYQGGKIAFLDATGLHGLLAAPVDQSNNATWTEADAACKALRLGGFSDWRLPSKAELLNNLYPNRVVISGFNPYNYWSSEGNNTIGECLNFSTVTFNSFNASERWSVRAVRTF